MIHSTAEVYTQKIGKQTTIWQYSVVLSEACIGDSCNINCHVFIENDVVIGNSVTIKSGVYLWDGIMVEDEVFIGPNVSFTNDKLPRSKHYPSSFQKTILRTGASIGAAAIILGGIEIGAYAMVAAGALVTKNVPARALVIGQPAKIIAWMNKDGTRMDEKGGYFVDNEGNEWIFINNELKLR